MVLSDVEEMIVLAVQQHTLLPVEWFYALQITRPQLMRSVQQRCLKRHRRSRLFTRPTSILRIRLQNRTATGRWAKAARPSREASGHFRKACLFFRFQTTNSPQPAWANGVSNTSSAERELPQPSNYPTLLSRLAEMRGGPKIHHSTRPPRP